jgi:tetratricopeptide (TPR) repeat protein
VNGQESAGRTRRELTPAQAFDMAVALQQKGRLAEAAQVYRALLKLKPDHFGALHHLGMIASQQGRASEAERLIRQALALEPDSAAARTSLGIALGALGRLEEARAEYERALALDAAHVEARNNLGNTLHALGRFDEAIAQFEQALAVRPQAAEVHNNLGNALTAVGRHEEAVAKFHTALALRPEFAEAHNNLGIALARLGREDEAMAAYAMAIAHKPDYADAHRNFGNALAARNRLEAAIAHFERALAIDPNAAVVHNDLGSVLAALERHAEALAQFRKACALRPDFAEAINNHGNALAALKRHEEAVASYRKALTIRPDFPEAHGNLGNALEVLGRPDEAVASYQAALALNPRLADVHHNLGNLWSILGHVTESRIALETAVRLAPRKPEYYRGLAQTKHFSAGDPHLAAMQELARDETPFNEKDRIALHFALGKAYADCGEHEKSFRHYLEANALRRRQLHHDATATFANFNRIKAVFTPGLIAQKQAFGDSSEVPIFIFGMPRSGTTLVEQVLASHPNVFGAGELEDLRQAVSKLERPDSGGTPYPEFVPSMGEAEFRQLTAQYLAAAYANAPDALRVTDKMPGNFIFAGLIHVAFPHARMIHVRRDPVDTCLSCFTHLFTEGLGWSYDLADLGRYYRAYADLMEHWRRLLPAGAMLEVQYEDLVEDFEAQARRLLAYCGLAWDARCIAFHETQRAVRTASAVQVRQRLYRSSVGRWRVYQPWLGPLLEALGSD